MGWTTDDLRAAYLDFFQKKGHVLKKGSGLIPDDPSMLFTSAGMVQFKDIFWGRTSCEDSRIVTCQKCFRANDIDRVGKTWYHHTFFEMLGNFSFGDYFKKGAIELAWEFVTEALNLSPDKLWVSVYEADQEAYEIWRDEIGVTPERIEKLGREENWWGPVGDSGPCGPDAELFYDMGQQYGCGSRCRGLACDCNRFSELWNLVFTGYEMDSQGNIKELNRQNIDTGMGLERTAAVLQGVESDFEIDIFRPIVAAVEREIDRTSIDSEGRQLIYRISDHLRGAAFLISEGVLPSNEGRGYVLRRVIRRAVRAGEKLNADESFLVHALPAVVEVMGETYLQLRERRELIENVLKNEEENYRQTLRRGEEIFYRVVEQLKREEREEIPGEEAFRLYDTHGVPLTMIKNLAAERGLSVDEQGFRQKMEEQRTRAQKDFESEEKTTVGKAVETSFVGYDLTEVDNATVSLVVEEGREVNSLFEGLEGAIVLDRTPFYAEGGGQVSDRGIIKTTQGTATVTGVKRKDNYYHYARVVEGKIEKGQQCNARVDVDRRQALQRNHTSTHLLHKALRDLLGSHVVQSGSKVAPDELRFDFNHFEPLSPVEIREIEDEVNGFILENLKVSTEFVDDVTEAKEKGATAHFEEEYRDWERLRIVSVDDISRELCGGTHVRRTGDIGFFLIVDSETIASGIRRIRAVTGKRALEVIRAHRQQLRELAHKTGSSVESLTKRIDALLQENDKLQEQLERKTERLLKLVKGSLLGDIQLIDSVQIVSGHPDLPPQDLKRLADMIEMEIDGVVLLGSGTGDTANLVCKVSTDIGDLLDASKIIEEISPLIEGGGGGSRSFAQGGGSNPSNISQALKSGIESIRSQLDRSGNKR